MQLDWTLQPKHFAQHLSLVYRSNDCVSILVLLMTKRLKTVKCFEFPSLALIPTSTLALPVQQLPSLTATVSFQVVLIALIDCAQCLFTAVTVNLQQTSYVFNEADDNTMVCALSVGASDIPFTVRFSTIDVTAQGKVDKCLL